MFGCVERRWPPTLKADGYFGMGHCDTIFRSIVANKIMSNMDDTTSSSADLSPPVGGEAVSLRQFVPRPPNPMEPTLVWKMSQTRVMFKEYKLWPSFIGARNESAAFSYAPTSKDKVGAVGLLPVLLWPEQEALLKASGFDINVEESDSTAESSSSSSAANAEDTVLGKKRRIDEVESDAEAETEAAAEAAAGTSIPTSSSSNINSSNSSNSGDSKQRSFKRSRAEEGDRSLVGKVGSFLWRMLTAPLSLLPGKKRVLTNPDMQQAVFNECVKMGYFVGPGDIYGGDYNIYRGGDPSNSHSTATVRVVRKKTITGRDLLSFSRVQNQVAKSAVLAYVDPETHLPRFLVANFRNVSDRM